MVLRVSIKVSFWREWSQCAAADMYPLGCYNMNFVLLHERAS